MRRTGLTMGLLAFCGGLAACGDDSVGEGWVISSQLTQSLDFPNGMVIDGNIPTTPAAPDATILPLGGTPNATPGEPGIMALGVDDEEGRTPAATLLQFGDDDSHVRIPVPEGSGNLIENTFTAGEDLCDGLCNTLYAVTVYVAVEFTSGEVSPVSEQTIIVDCTEHGDPAACGVEGAPDSGVIEGLACGSLVDGELVLTGIGTLDRYFDAVGQVPRSGEYASGLLSDAVAAMASALGLPANSDAAAVKTELESQIADNTETGLAATVGVRGCGIPSAPVVSTLQSCDPSSGASTPMQCVGACRLNASAANCPGGTEASCRGLLDEADCGGTCVGSCTESLDTPAMCGGTCSGMCSGACPDDGMGGCEGPCTGDCTGECRVLSTADCGGACTGLCRNTTDETCADPSRRFCTADPDAAECAGVCFGKASIPDTTAACELSATALGQLLPTCELSLVQLSFAFAAGLDESEQGAFATTSMALTSALSTLLDAVARAEMIAAAGNALEAAATGVEKDELDAALEDGADGAECAEDTMADVESIITDALAALNDDVQAAQSLLEPITIDER
jgi:hypothetical protein